MVIDRAAHPGTVYRGSVRAMATTKPNARFVRTFSSLHRTVAVRARITEGAERDAQFQRFVDSLDNNAQCAAATDRVIPVVLLEPVAR